MEFRLYSFCNFYLSSIQQGIQTAHLVQELNNSYPAETSPEAIILSAWGRHHKTIVVLNGGMAEDIENCYQQLQNFCGSVQSGGVGLPFAKFHEDEKSLSSTMTCCGFVAPDEIYDAVDFNTASRIVGKDIADRAGAAHLLKDDTTRSIFGLVEGLRFYIAKNAEGKKVIERVYDESMPEWHLSKLIRSCGLAK